MNPSIPTPSFNNNQLMAILDSAVFTPDLSPRYLLANPHHHVIAFLNSSSCASKAVALQVWPGTICISLT